MKDLEISSKVFNLDKTDYSKVSLLLGEEDLGLLDTINKQYPEVWSVYKSQKADDWDENEFDYSTCLQDFKTCSKSQSDTMIYTLAWQWEADSVAAKSIINILGPFITSSELMAAWMKISEIEVLHAATYSEIVRMSFENPEEVLGEILGITESFQRLNTVGRVFSETYEASHKYALGMIPNDQETYNHAFKFICALYMLERIQFMSSFAITFANAETGLFQPIAKAVQKIAKDELEHHVALDRFVLRHEMKTERGKRAMVECKDDIEAMLNEVVNSELEWTDFLFSEGRELVGVNADSIKKWVLYNAIEVYNLLDVESPHEMPERNPLRFMTKWLNINLTQPAPQEQDIAEYRLHVVQSDDDGVEFDIDF